MSTESSFSRICRGIFSTWSLRSFLPDGRVIDPSEYPFGRQIFAACESDTVALAAFGVDLRIVVLIALGRDGDLATSIGEGIGWRAVRGSSARRGSADLRGLIRSSAAMRELTRCLRTSDSPAVISVDGPLGPAEEAKEGVILCAQRSRRPVVPIGAAARSRVVVPGTWSGLFLPLPFTRVAAVVGETLLVPEDCSRRQRRELAAELTLRLKAARMRARQAVRVWPAVTSTLRPEAVGA